MKKVLLTLLASAGLACADDWNNDRFEQQELQRQLDQQQMEHEMRNLRWDIEDQQRHMRWEASDREARAQEHYDW